MVGTLTLAALAATPIAAAFALLLWLRWSAARAMGVGWLIATVLGLAYWQMDPTWLVASAIYGALGAIDIILIVFGAILLMNYLDISGAISTIRWHFSGIATDKRIQLLLIGLGFITIIEGVAGFGTPGALAAPLLIGLGFPPLGAAVFALFFNAPNPQFGAAGTPILGGVNAVIDEGKLAEAADPITQAEFQALVSGYSGVVTGLTFAFWGVLGIFLLVYWFGSEHERSIRGAARATVPVAPFAVVLGVVAGLTQWSIAWFVGTELPSIVAGFVVFGLGLAMADRGILVPGETWTFPERESWSDLWLGGLTLDSISGDEPKKEMPVLLAWAPYLLVGVVLLVTRWPTLDLVPVLQEFSVSIPVVLGYSELGWELQYLYLPGTMPFIPVAILTGLIYRMNGSDTAEAWRESTRQIAPAALTLVIVVSLTQIMIQSGEAAYVNASLGMMGALSQAVAFGAGGALPAVAPWIGALGGFVTGSNTVSDILFAALQYDAAGEVGISRSIVVALQNVGGGIGNMISVQNIAAICGVVGITGREGDILRKTVVPTILFALFAGAVGMVLVYVVAPGAF
ncbi:L-lactate permease [Halapricum hydrolyticum]|uniref:L-lactate permease n=1 Tax=Halapricum hydrolyticum TaxID=2979991 RepID=A0AAE3IBB5_9EURY|nr:L-lactate permease [Halapricum hydrolyticum]MCU4717111.1 L-lactate permease [Halapricum hydrolyticum]MCU4726038.1 L-lactate permease [Halapricum hydrolyticum]